MAINNTLKPGLMQSQLGYNPKAVPMGQNTGSVALPQTNLGSVPVIGNTQTGVTGNNANQPLAAQNSLTGAGQQKPPQVINSPGSYRGVPITGGDQSSIGLQMAKIDGTNTSNPTTALPQSAPIPGLLPPPVQSANPYQAGAPTFGGLVGGLASTAAGPTPQYTTAQEQYNTANQQLADLKQASANNQFIGAGTNMAEYAGTQGLLANRLANQENALAGEMSAAQAAAGVASGQQGVQQSGLAAAGGLAQPSQGGPTNVPFNPLTGQYGTPSAGAYGAGNGLQQVGNIQGQIGVGQNVAQLNSYLGGANVVGQNLNSLIDSGNINPSGLKYANGALQFAQSALSNPDYQKFQGQINDFVSSLAPILGTGGSVTDMKTQMSSQIVDALQSGSTIKDVVNYFLQQAQQKIQGLSAGGGAPVGTTGGTTFGSFF